MDNPYFLTRQTANLMEDFARELNAGSALYLLYGEPRVGKTRLLDELRRNRLGDKAVHWIDLANAPEDLESADLSNEIERLFEQTAPGDVVIADHFELALKKTRHQLFLSWSTDGVDKQLNLIIASNLEGFNELRLLSQQYQVRVQSFQLMPLDDEEVEAFLGHYLFPEHPLGKLTMPAPLRRQVADAHGVIGNLIEIAEHDGSHIETGPLADSESIRSGSRVIVAVLLLFGVALGVGWYFFVEPESSLVEIPLAPAPIARDAAETVAAPAADADVAPDPPASEAPVAADAAVVADETASEAASIADAADASDPAVVTDVASAGPLSEAPADPVAVPQSDDAIPAVSAPVTSDDGSEASAPAESDPMATVGDAVEIESPVVDQTVDASATARQAERADGDGGDTSVAIASLTDPEPPAPPADAAVMPRDRLLRELKRSLDWLYASDENRGTIQVLLLSFEGFDPASYFDYVDDIGRREVDTGQLRIVKTFTGGKTVYSVFFGDYDSRQAALRAIDDMPEALRKSGPIPRSLGGIWEEIRRLPEQN